MKQFALTVIAVLIGGLVSLFLYDRFIVQPREQVLQQKETSAVLERARAEGKDIAAGIDASVQKSVADAKATFDAQAAVMSERALVADAITRGGMFKVALTDFYQSEGKWPKDNAAIGMAKPAEYAGNAVTSIGIGAQGAVHIALNDKFEPGAVIKLIPTANAQTVQLSWRCETENSAKLATVLTACNTQNK
jgi:hypothetical protein